MILLVGEKIVFLSNEKRERGKRKKAEATHPYYNIFLLREYRENHFDFHRHQTFHSRQTTLWLKLNIITRYRLGIIRLINHNRITI